MATFQYLFTLFFANRVFRADSSSFMATFEQSRHIFSFARLTFFKAKFFACALSTFVAFFLTSLLAFKFHVVKCFSVVAKFRTLMSTIQTDLTLIRTLLYYFL